MRLINFLSVALTSPAWLAGFLWNKAKNWFHKGEYDSETIDAIEIKKTQGGA